jgi:putative transcriptional regulator
VKGVPLVLIFGEIGFSGDISRQIITNVDVMMAKRKISLNELSEKVDLTLPNLSILKTGKAKAIRFTTLDAICKALNCQPGDILEYIDEEKRIADR